MRISNLIKRLENIRKNCGDLKLSYSNTTNKYDMDLDSFRYIFMIGDYGNGKIEMNICTE